MREMRAVAGIEKTSPAFRRKVIEIADRNKLNADYLMSVMSFETGHTFSPTQENMAGSGALGLIQFLTKDLPGRPSTATTLGTSGEKLKKMTAVEQLDYVEKYYKRVAPNGLQTLEDHYLVVLTGGRHAPDAVLFKSGTKAYEQNKGFDKNGDGTITAAEATTPVRFIYEAAANKPTIQVDMSAPVVEAGAGSILLVALTGWTMVQIVMHLKGKHL